MKHTSRYMIVLYTVIYVLLYFTWCISLVNIPNETHCLLLGTHWGCKFNSGWFWYLNGYCQCSSTVWPLDPVRSKRRAIYFPKLQELLQYSKSRNSGMQHPQILGSIIQNVFVPAIGFSGSVQPCLILTLERPWYCFLRDEASAGVPVSVRSSWDYRRSIR